MLSSVAIELKEVVPWGRSMAEYIGMFDLRESHLSSRILGCGDGPASFNVEMTELNRNVISCDPVYVFTAGQIRQRVEETRDYMIDAVRAHPEGFVWNRIRSPEHLRDMRMGAMEKFIADFSTGLRQGRYIAASLPDLPFASASFDLALCSHLLFLYSDHLSLDFHIRSIIEMCRVARECRIFPLLMLGSRPSSHVAPVIKRLNGLGYTTEIRTVPYEFQKGGNEMLAVTPAM